jgi:hypothetical protein
MRTKDNGPNPDIMEPRAVYYALQALWTSLTPDIKANGSDGPVSIPEGDPISVTVKLDPRIYLEVLADW